MRHPLFEEVKPIADFLKLFCDTSLENERHLTSHLFSGLDLVLIGETEGAITTQARFDDWTDSLAHLMPDGRVMCYGKQIGTIEDLEFDK